MTIIPILASIACSADTLQVAIPSASESSFLGTIPAIIGAILLYVWHHRKVTSKILKALPEAAKAEVKQLDPEEIAQKAAEAAVAKLAAGGSVQAVAASAAAAGARDVAAQVVEHAPEVAP